MAKAATDSKPDTAATLNDLTAQVGTANASLSAVQNALSNQKVLEWISLALAVLGFAAAAILFMRRKK